MFSVQFGLFLGKLFAHLSLDLLPCARRCEEATFLVNFGVDLLLEFNLGLLVRILLDQLLTTELAQLNALPSLYLILDVFQVSSEHLDGILGCRGRLASLNSFLVQHELHVDVDVGSLLVLRQLLVEYGFERLEAELVELRHLLKCFE